MAARRPSGRTARTGTPFFYGEETPERVAYHRSQALGGDLTKIEDIVPILRHLATDGWWITGQTLFANGGYTTRWSPRSVRKIPSPAEDTMPTDVLTNPTVKATIDALQRGDRAAWSAQFEPDAELYDDGNRRSLERFTRDAIGHERFTSIDRVSEDGLELVGNLHTEQWGDFRAYFRFRLSASGRIERLDIGQAG